MKNTSTRGISLPSCSFCDSSTPLLSPPLKNREHLLFTIRASRSLSEVAQTGCFQKEEDPIIDFFGDQMLTGSACTPTSSLPMAQEAQSNASDRHDGRYITKSLSCTSEKDPSWEQEETSSKSFLPARGSENRRTETTEVGGASTARRRNKKWSPKLEKGITFSSVCPPPSLLPLSISYLILHDEAQDDKDEFHHTRKDIHAQEPKRNHGVNSSEGEGGDLLEHPKTVGAEEDAEMEHSCRDATFPLDEQRNRDGYYMAPSSSFASSHTVSLVSPSHDNRSSQLLLPPRVAAGAGTMEGRGPFFSAAPSSFMAYPTHAGATVLPAEEKQRSVPKTCVDDNKKSDRNALPSPSFPSSSSSVPSRPVGVVPFTSLSSSLFRSPLDSGEVRCFIPCRAYTRTALRCVEKREGMLDRGKDHVEKWSKDKASRRWTPLDGKTSPMTMCVASPPLPQAAEIVTSLVKGVWCDLGLFQSLPAIRDSYSRRNRQDSREEALHVHVNKKRAYKDTQEGREERKGERKSGGHEREAVHRNNSYPLEDHNEEDEKEEEEEFARADMLCRWLVHYLHSTPLATSTATTTANSGGERCHTVGVAKRETPNPMGKSGEEGSDALSRSLFVSSPSFLSPTVYTYFTRSLWHVLWNMVMYCLALHTISVEEEAHSPTSSSHPVTVLPSSGSNAGVTAEARKKCTTEPLRMDSFLSAMPAHRSTSRNAATPPSLTFSNGWKPCRLRYEVRKKKPQVDTSDHHCAPDTLSVPHHSHTSTQDGKEQLREDDCRTRRTTATTHPRPTTAFSFSRSGEEDFTASSLSSFPMREGKGMGETMPSRHDSRRNKAVSEEKRRKAHHRKRGRRLLYGWYDGKALCDASYGRSNVLPEWEEKEEDWESTSRERKQDEVEQGIRGCGLSSSYSFSYCSPPRPASHRVGKRRTQDSFPSSTSSYRRPSCVISTAQWRHLLRSLAVLQYPRALFYTQTLRHSSPAELLLVLLWCTKRYRLIEMVEHVVLQERFPFMLLSREKKEEEASAAVPSSSTPESISCSSPQQQLETLLANTMNWPPLHFDFSAVWEFRKKQQQQQLGVITRNTMDVPSSSSHVGEEHEGERGGRNRGHSSSCTDSSTTMCPLSSRVSDAHSCVSSGLAFPSHRITEWTRRLLGIQKHFFSSLYRLEHALMERTRCLHELRQLIPPIRTTMSEACVEGTYPSRLPLSSEAAKAVPSIPTHTPAARGFTRTAPLSTQILLPAPPLDLLLCSLARPEEDSDSEEEEDEEEEKEGKRGEDEKSKEMVNTYRCSGTKAPSLYALYRGGLYYSAGIPSRVRRRWMYLSVLGTAVKNALLTPATESEMERSVWRCSKGREESRGSEVGGRLRVNRPTVDSHSFPSFPSSVLPTPPCSQAQDEDHTAFPLSFFLHTSPYAFTPMPPLYVPTPATNSSLKTKTIPADMVHRSTSFWCTECRWMEGLNADTSMPIPTSPTGLHHHTKYKREKEVLFAPLPAQAEEGHRSEEEVRSSSSATVRKQWERPTTEHFTSFSGSFSSFVSSSSLTHFFRSCAWNRSSTDRVVQSILEDRRASSTSEGGAECASKEEEMNNTGIPLQDLRQRFAATHCRETLANTWKRMSRQALLWNAAQRGSASGFSSSSTSATATRRTAPSALSSRHCGSTPKPVDVPPFSWRLFFHDQDLFISRNMRDHYSLHGALLASLLEQRDQQALVSSTISLPSSCCHSPSLAVYSRDMEKRKHHHETEQKNTLFHCFPLYSTFRVPRWNVWLTREMESRTGRVTEKKKTYDASREEDTDRDGDLFRSEKAGDRTSAAGSDVAVFRPAPPCLMEGGVEWKDFCRVSLRNLKGKGEHPTCIDARDENLSFATSAFLELQRLQVLRNKLEFIASENGRRSGSQTSASCTLHRITPRNNIHHPLKRGASDPLWESLERKCCTQEDRGLAAVGTLQRVYGLRLILRDSNSRREETTSSSFGC